MSKILVHVRSKDTCGRILIDPVCELSKLLKTLKKSKTLSPEDILPLVNIGYKIEYTGDRVKVFDEKEARYLGAE